MHSNALQIEKQFLMKLNAANLLFWTNKIRRNLRSKMHVEKVHIVKIYTLINHIHIYITKIYTSTDQLYMYVNIYIYSRNYIYNRNIYFNWSEIENDLFCITTKIKTLLYNFQFTVWQISVSKPIWFWVHRVTNKCFLSILYDFECTVW